MNKSTASFDAAALGEELSNLAVKHGGSTADGAKAAIAARLKTIVAEGRGAAEAALRKDGRGRACAERISLLQDDLVRLIHAFACRTAYPAKGDRPEPMAIVAVGGYGRGTLAPGSDIDLLFLMSAKQTRRAEDIVQYVLHTLWSVGFKVGYAVRSVDECIKQAKADMTIRTSVLEARPIVGDQTLFDELVQRFDREVVKGTGPQFIAAKLAERDERHIRQGQSRYLVEPNVKDGKGGLRDLNTLFWIAKYFYRVEQGEQLVKAGVFSRAELNRFRKCEDFLWAVRCHLHFMTGRAEERLLFEFQQGLAERLGYAARPGLKDVERFMKHYFLVAKDVGDLTGIFCAALEEQHAKPTPPLNRLLGFGKRHQRAVHDAQGFVVENRRINIADPELFARDPVNILRLFHLADRSELALHPDAMRQVVRSHSLINADLRQNGEANKCFLEIVTSKRSPETVLRRMNETGVLGRFVPEFGRIVSMMQFSLYHHYTVDEHLLRTVGIVSELERGDLKEDHPVASQIVPTLSDRRLIYLAAFLHDIAKGRAEDHSIAGARIARKLCPRLGLDAGDTETVAWLVEHHLLMSTVAQRKDLGDRKTILDFAAVVQSLDRLKLLLILTIADIRAVGPGVWNGWKGQLLRTLYWETEPILTGGHSQVSREARVAEAKAEFAAACSWPEAEKQAYLGRHYPAYWLRVDIKDKLAHAEMIRAADAAGRSLATAVKVHGFEAITEITVLAPDHPRLLSIIAGACTVAGANIVDAQIFTTTDGRALDTIRVTREFATDEDEERRGKRIGTLIEEVLSGKTRLPETIAKRAKPRAKLKPFQVETRIRIDNSWSNMFTAIETSGLDRPGLLYELTRSLSDLNLNIGSAHIVTVGERAVDVFYVTDLFGHKVANPTREAAIKRRLANAFGEPAAPEPRAPRRSQAA